MSAPRRSILLGIACVVSGGAVADVSSAIRDAAARVEYGFLTADRSLVLAARDGLSSPSRDPWSAYVAALASYRAAQLTQARNVAANDLVDACLSDAEAAAAATETELEALILIAACSELAARSEPVRSVLHQRRYRRAVERALTLDPLNPRLVLVRSTAVQFESPAPDNDAVVDAFRQNSQSFAFPDWGEAEALTVGAKLALAAGNWARARDLIEEALIIAPEYHEVLGLREQLMEIVAGD